MMPNNFKKAIIPCTDLGLDNRVELASFFKISFRTYVFERVKLRVLDDAYDVIVDALDDLPEGTAGRGGLHVVDDVPVKSGLMITDVECQGGQSLGSIPDNGDADEEGDEEEALEEGRGVGRRVGDHRGLAQLEENVNESG